MPPPKESPFTAQMMGFLPLRLDRPPKPEGGCGVRGLSFPARSFHSEEVVSWAHQSIYGVSSSCPVVSGISSHFNQGCNEIENLPFKSAPAQNALPFPVKMPTRRLGSASIHSHTASRSAWPCELMQFNARGRLSVTRRTCGAGNERRAC